MGDIFFSDFLDREFCTWYRDTEAFRHNLRILTAPEKSQTVGIHIFGETKIMKFGTKSSSIRTALNRD